MKKIILHPNQILRAGGDGGIVPILDDYVAKYRHGRADDIAPALVVVNEPNVIRETLESRARNEVTSRKENPLTDYRRIDDIIPITADPNKVTWTDLKFSDLLMRSFDFNGIWEDFVAKYEAGNFHPLYINPNVLMYEGEIDIIETCTRDNQRLTYGERVLTKQQYEQRQQSFQEEIERETSILLHRDYFRFEDVEPLMRNYQKQGALYMLADGTHRAIAATITRNQINGLLLESDEDVQEAIRMVERGEIKDFKWREQTLKGLQMSSYDFYAGNIDSVSTVQKLANRLSV